MEGYGYPYPPQYPPGRGPGGEFPDHGDGFGGADQYYGMNTLNDPVSKRLYSGYWSYPGYPDPYHYLPPPFFGQCGEPMEWSHPYYFQWPSCSKYRDSKHTKRSRSREDETKSRSRSRSKSRSRSRTPSRTSTRSHSRTRSRSASRNRELTFKEPGILDAFRVMYLTPSKHKKSTTKYLATKKRQDRITELLKSDGLGSKRWLFYPRPRPNSEPEPTTGEVPGSRDNCDQRIKVDGDFFRKYKKRKKVDVDAPIAKLKRWELILYQKLGFVQAV